jgi:ATP-dependent Clp protease ATP-binding subunit ClpC
MEASLTLRYDLYDPEAQQAAQNAVAILDRYGHHLITIEHLLMSILEQQSEEVLRLLKRQKINIQSIAEQIDLFLRNAPRNEHLYYSSEHVFISPLVPQIMEMAHQEATRSMETWISPWHIFLAILREGDSPAFRILEGAGLTYARAIENVKDEFSYDEEGEGEQRNGHRGDI